MTGLVVAGLLMATGSQLVPASAAVTYAPNPDDTSGVIRDSTVSVKLDAASMGLHYNRNTTGTSGVNFAVVNPTLAALTPCRGDNPGGLRNFSPRATVSLSNESGELASVGTPARDYNLFALSSPSATQPTAPGDDIFRGGDTRGAGSSFTANFDLSGKPAGTYTLTTTTYSRIREVTKSLGGTLVTNCAIGTPTGTQTWAPGPVVTTKTFEYRPWQHVFTDVFGNGKVSLNTNPAETQVRQGNDVSAIHAGNQTGFALPTPGAFMLPADPSACAGDPMSCLPAGSVPCDPANGCEPRILIVNYDDGTRGSVRGVFDVESGAYIALTKIADHTRLQASLGPAGDAQYQALLTKLSDTAAAQGIDLPSLLASRVQVSTGEKAISLSVLNALQIDPTSTPRGVQIFTAPHAAAGLILNVYSTIAGACGPAGTSTSGDSDPTTAALDSYTPQSGFGYTVKHSDLLPDLPRVSPVDALGVGGPIYSIHGDFTAPTSLANITMPLAGVDTLAGEPNGYPVWIEALGLAGSPILTESNVKTMDFLGTAAWSASETSLGALGCLTVDFMLGTGVAVFNSPFKLGFGDLPVMWNPNPATAQAKATLNSALSEALNQVTTNPAVAGLLEQVTGALPIPDSVGGVPLP